MIRLAVLWLLFFTSLKGEDLSSSPLSLVNLTDQPLPRIHGTVNVISGDWVEQEVHEHPSGPDSYCIGHSYTSSDEQEGSLSHGWNFLWPSYIESNFYSVDECSSEFSFDLYEAGGVHLLFKRACDNKHRYITPCLGNTGYTHISTIDHPSSNDASRIKLNDSKKYDGTLSIHLPDGTIKIFKRIHVHDKDNRFYEKWTNRSQHFFLIASEILPSKNIRHFTYDKEGKLLIVKTLSSCGTYLIQKITLRHTKDAVFVKSLDGREVRFDLQEVHHKDRYDHKKTYQLISKIHRAGAPDREYTYEGSKDDHPTRIEQRTWATGLTEEALYYTDNDTTRIFGEKVHVPSKEREYVEKRVKEVRTKRFKGEKPFAKHGFYYDRKHGADHYRILRVADIDDFTTGYMWNPDHRLIWSTYYDQKENQLASEHFVWKEDGDTGRLVQRAVFDEKKNPLLLRTWHFTPDGFPEKECWYGLFTSHKAPDFSVHDKTDPQGGEKITLMATWDTKGKLMDRTDAEGNLTECEYDRCFLSARYTFWKRERITAREFYTYDTAGCLTQSIRDDGSKKEKSDLEGVTRRSITTYHRRHTAPHFGEPERITYSVWTPEEGEKFYKEELFDRDASGRVTCHTLRSYDDLVIKTLYEYDSIDRLIKTTFPDGSFEEITYYEVSGLIKEKAYPDRRVRYQYDLYSRPILERVIYPDGTYQETTTDYDQSGRMVTSLDRRGQKSTIEKDLLGRITSKTSPSFLTSSKLITPKETYRYEGNRVFWTSPTGKTTETLYSSLGKPLLIRHPEGYTTTYTYDLLGRQLETSDGNLTHTTTYDTRGRVKRTQTLANEVLLEWQQNHYQGTDLVEVESEFLHTKMKYDAFGRLIEKKMIDPATGQSMREKTQYDGLDRVVRIENNSLIHEYTYDVMGRLIKEKETSLDGTPLMHKKTHYDLAGRVVQEEVRQDESTWMVTKTTYGAYGLVSSVEAPDGATTRHFYSYKNTTWTSTTVDPLGVTTIETYTAANSRPTSTKVQDPFGTTLSEVRCFVSILNLPESIEQDVYYQGKKEETLLTRLTHDAFGRLKTLREAVGSDEEVSTHRSYDCYGRCTEETLPSGVCFTMTYDKKGRLTRKSSSDGTVDLAFQYTSHDCVKEASDLIKKTATRRTYDGFKHLLTDSQSNGLKISYRYNDEGLLDKLTLPDDTSLSYTYCGGLLRSIHRALPASSYTFAITKRNHAGMILESSLPLSAGVVQYTYDMVGRVLSKEQPLIPETRRYDQVGRVIARTIDAEKEKYQYDYLSQLISDNGRERRYDSLLRLREEEGDATEVTRRQQITHLGKKRFSYDLDGRRTRDGRAHLSYDALGRLISFEKDGQVEQYEYDAFSRRMSSSSGGQVERYVWMGQHDVGTYSPSGEAISFRVLAEGVGTEGGATVAVELHGIPYTSLSDLSGNIRVLLSKSQGVAHQATYSAFQRTSTSGIDCPWGFFSKRHDSLSGYVVFLYRLYDPVTSSWITQDPLGLEGGPNLYAYVKNNPLTLFDHLGLLDWDSFCSSVSSFFSDCGTAISNCCTSIGEAIGNAYEHASSAVSTSVSAIGHSLESCASGIGNACSWAGTTISSGYKSFCDALEPAPAPTPQTHWENGQTVDENTDFSAGVYIYGFGNLDEFLAAVEKDPSLWDKIARSILGDGINTSMWECMIRAEKIISRSSTSNNRNKYVAIAYNPKVGIGEACGKATTNILGFKTKDVISLASDLHKFYTHAAKAGHENEFSIHCHSHFAAIFDCILDTSAFTYNSTDSCAKVLGKIYTYGGATLIPGAINFISFFDPIPFINPRNWATMILHPECVQFTPFQLQSPLHAHGFDNPSYWGAFEQASGLK